MPRTRAIDRLLEVMVRLRAPQGGCPWDVQQTFDTIAPYTIEEAHEVADAITRNDMPDLVDELGDLLFQVVFHARIGEELGHFDFEDVANAIVEKMVRRHPHVFAGAKVADAEAQTRAWETLKAHERRRGATGPASALDDIPASLPATARAAKLQRRAARDGFDWPDVGGVLAKVDEELAELREAVESGSARRVDDELGDLLFTCINLSRRLEIDADGALRRASRRFEERYRRMESLAGESGGAIEGLEPAERERLWERAKSEER